MKGAVLAGVALVVAACAADDGKRSSPSPDPALADAGPADPSACRACASWGDPDEAGRVEDSALTELSGLAASRTHAGV